MNDIAIIAREQLEKEYRRLCINLKHAESKYMSPVKEIDDLKRKIAVNLYLQQRCE